MTLQKINTATNVVTWFEIPVLNSERAKKFYETILDIEMRTQRIEETKEELTFFPSVPGVVQATSGRVTGILLKSNHSKPSKEGPLIYLNASPNLQKVIDRIEPAGGKVVTPKTKIVAGYYAVLIDTEGNKVAIHSEE